MKKIFFTAFVAVMTLGTMTLASCGGQKAENQEIADEAETVTGATTADYNEMTDVQKTALLESGLVDESAFAKSIFIDFNATWCGPCKQFGPYFEASAEKYAGKASFIAVDVDNYPMVADAFGVQSIPMLVALMPDGKYVTYIGTQELVGDGAFDTIVETYLR